MKPSDRPVRSGGSTRFAFVAALFGLASCAAPSGPPLSPGDAAAVDRVQAWLDGAHGLRARFLQIWPDGAISAGNAAFDPPGRLRLDYLPGGMTLVASAGRIVVTDPRTGSVTRTPTSATPLGLLLEPDALHSAAVRVTDVEQPAGALQISLARAADLPAGLLTLTFDAPPTGPLQLVRIEAVDAEHRITRFRLSDETTGAAFPSSEFVPPS